MTCYQRQLTEAPTSPAPFSKLWDAVNKYGTRECRLFRGDHIRRHFPIERELLSAYLSTCRNSGYQRANSQLREYSRALAVTEYRFSATMDDEDIRQLSDQFARKCERAYSKRAIRGDFDGAIEAAKIEVEAQGIEWPADVKQGDSPETARGKQAAAAARAQTPTWWRRKLRVVCGRKVEAVLRDSGAVCSRRAPYLSDWAHRRWLCSQTRNAGLLANLDAVNQDGDIVPLEQCVEASVSNPVNRRHELMTRIGGWEALANAMDLKGLFLTLTCPSAYHAILSQSGQVNPNYNGSTPAEAQQYLCGVWARIRAAWKRAGIKSFGLRVCEPHHDGTPHFHFVLFFSPEHIEPAWEIFQKHALTEDGNEHGAHKHRAVRVDADPTKGSATGYIAKYISKNIDGYGFSTDELGDESGMPPEQNAGRIRAWASLWGIRQFQQIGSCSVTVWRELRKLSEPLDGVDQALAEQLRSAADRGHWAEFVELMGGEHGPFAGRNQQAMRALLFIKEKPGQYGEDITHIVGVALRQAAREIAIRTRFTEWMIVPRGAQPCALNLAERSPPPWTCVNNCTPSETSTRQ